MIMHLQEEISFLSKIIVGLKNIKDFDKAPHQDRKMRSPFLKKRKPLFKEVS